MASQIRMQKKQARHQSLMSTINKFVEAVDEMQDTVMIPNRLKDMTVPPADTTVSKVPRDHDMGSDGGHVSSDESDDSTSSIDGADGIHSRDLIPIPFSGQGTNGETDLFKFYQMLGAVKEELARDPKNIEDAIDSDQDERSLQAAAQFRYHLRGLFGVLHQLTDTANGLTSRYQDELGLNSISSSSLYL